MSYIILPFDGNHADIPSGWSRDTNLDGKIPKGASSSLGTTGGSNTHTHTASHSHSIATHSHTATTDNPFSGGQDDMGSSGSIAAKYHTHSGGSTGVASGGTTGTTSASLTSSTENSLPPYYEVIFITTDTWYNIPVDGMVFTESSRSGLTFHSASNNRFLRGATTAGDAGGIGGASTHVHSQTHTHTTSAHAHATGYTGYTSGSGEDGGTSPAHPQNHRHSFEVQNSTQAINSDNTDASSVSSLPYNKTLQHYVATTTTTMEKGDIAMTTDATTPSGWLDCDGTNGTPDMDGFYVQNNATANTTSGSNVHGHTVSHSHTGNGTHTHTPNNPTGMSGAIGGRNGSGYDGKQDHDHYINSISDETANTTTATATSSTDNSEPEYILVKFIQLEFLGKPNYTVGNILRTGETQDNSVKASIIRTETSSNSVKANIVGEEKNCVKANIQLTYRDKKYYYRIYDGQTFVTSWANEVLNEPAFRTIINGGASDINVKLARNYDDFGEDVDVKLNNRVEIFVSDRESPNGHMIYSGYITGYRPILDGSREHVEVTIFSWVGELSRYLLRDSSGNTEVAYSSEDPSDILTDIIDKYRADGGFINYNATSIDLTGTTVSYTFNTNTVRETLDKVIELCPDGWYWRITPQGVIHLHEREDTSDHEFTLGKHISSMSTFRRIEDMVNRVYFTGGGDPPLYRLYENTGSIGAYGLYATKMVDQRVTDTSTAETMATRLLDSKKDPEIRTKLSILDSNGQQSVRGYDIESVYVGQTMEILGQHEDTKTISLWDQMEWDVDVWDQTLASSANAVIQILSISYSSNKIMIEASSRLPEVPKRIEDINRNLQDSQTVNNPTAPS